MELMVMWISTFFIKILEKTRIFLKKGRYFIVQKHINML